MRPVFHILTIVKDHPDGLRRTWESVRSQRWPHRRWYVSDGGSGAATRQVVEEAIRAGDVHWWRSGPDAGPFDAMNLALDRSGQEPDPAGFVIVLNAGDMLAGPDVLSTLAAIIDDRRDVDIICGASIVSVGTTQRIIKQPRSPALRWLGMITHHPAIAVRGSLAWAIRYPLRYTIGSDYAYMLTALNYARGISLTHEPLAIVEPGGLSERNAARGRSEQCLIRSDYLGLSDTSNRMISAAQCAVWTLRQAAPNLYGRLRLKIRNRKSGSNMLQATK